MTLDDSKMTALMGQFEWCFPEFEWGGGGDGEHSFWPLEKKKKNLKKKKKF